MLISFSKRLEKRARVLGRGEESVPQTLGPELARPQPDTDRSRSPRAPSGRSTPVTGKEPARGPPRPRRGPPRPRRSPRPLRVRPGQAAAREQKPGSAQGFRSHSEGESGFVPRPRRQEAVERDRPQFSSLGVETKPERRRLSAPPEVAPPRRGRPEPRVRARFPGLGSVSFLVVAIG